MITRLLTSVVNVGLIIRSLRETWITASVLCASIYGVSFLMGFAFPRIQERIMSRGGPTQAMLQFRATFLGDQAALAVPGQIAAGIQWSHPVLLSLLFAKLVIMCTRMPAGETDRGTIDLLMGLPVSRWAIYVSETIVAIFWSVMLVMMALAGAYMARGTVNEKVLVEWDPVFRVGVNLGFLLIAVMGVASLFSAMSERRGRAVLSCVLVLLAWILMEFLGGLWEPMKNVEWLSALHYYKPLAVIRAEGLPWDHLGILLGIGVVTWVIGGVVFSRRGLTAL
jgi:ABC-type transport system involved in multi-copper enzyme maturation permease subunit